MDFFGMLGGEYFGGKKGVIRGFNDARLVRGGNTDA